MEFPVGAGGPLSQPSPQKQIPGCSTGEGLGSTNGAVHTLQGDVSAADERCPLHQGVRPAAWAAGIASHAPVRPRHLQKCFTERPPRDGGSSLGEAARLGTEPPPPSLPAWPCFCFSSQCSLCDSWGQEPACSCDHRHVKDLNQESGREESPWVSPTNPGDSR